MWNGPPKWNGKVISPSQIGPIEGKFYATIIDPLTKIRMPLIILIEGTDDPFFLMFSTKEKLNNTVTKFLKKIGVADYRIEIIRDKKILEAFYENKVRIMHDPVVIDDHHTKWTEVVKENEVYKYVNVENN